MSTCGCPEPTPPPAPRKFNRRRLLGGGFTALSTAAVGAYLIGPGTWQWERAQAHAEHLRHPLEQIETAPGTVDAALVERLRNTTVSLQSSPLIITYHDLSPKPDSQYTVHPQQFADQMQLLHEAGWTTMTSDQVDAWHRGEPVPPRSVLITFDDGCMGVWQYAEPVLRRLNMKAAAFIITGFIGTHEPYYMEWEKVADLHSTGRWDILAHTHIGHVYVPADATGGTGPFLTTPMYLKDQNRVETQNEYHARVHGDLVECKRQLGLQGFGEPRFFAYPFSAHEADVTQQTVLSLYGGGGMLDDAHLIQVTTAEDVSRGLIRRMDITGAVTLDGFIAKLEQASPIDPTGVQPLLDRDGWTDNDQMPTTAITISPDGHAVVDPGPGKSISLQYQRIRTAMWSNYTVTADLGIATDPSDPNSTTSTGIVVFNGGPEHQVVVSVARGYYSVFVGNADQPVVAGDIVDLAEYHVEIVASPAAVAVTINGEALPVVTLPPQEKARMAAGGIGLVCRREADISPVSTINNLVIT